MMPTKPAIVQNAGSPSGLTMSSHGTRNTASASKIATGTYSDTSVHLREIDPRREYSTRGRTGNRQGLRGRLGMSPGGHLATTAVACAGVAALTGSWTLTAAVA